MITKKEIKQYNERVELKKLINREVCKSSIPFKSIIEMLEELINLYKE